MPTEETRTLKEALTLQGQHLTMAGALDQTLFFYSENFGSPLRVAQVLGLTTTAFFCGMDIIEHVIRQSLIDCDRQNFLPILLHNSRPSASASTTSC